MTLTKKRLAIIVPAASAIVLLALYLILFRPLTNRVEALRREYRALTISASQAREAINSLNPRELAKELVSQANVSMAIEELTRDGKAGGVKLISLVPGQIERRQSFCDTLPIEITLEASFAALGDFLGRLDDLNRSVVCVRKLNVVSNKANPRTLSARLSLDMHILE